MYGYEVLLLILHAVLSLMKLRCLGYQYYVPTELEYAVGSPGVMIPLSSLISIT